MCILQPTLQERTSTRVGLPGRLIMALALLAGTPAVAQMPGGPPPAVGVVAARQEAITRSSEYIARIQATNRVNLVARVAAYLDEVLFTDGAEVRKGQLLYRLEQGPFQADVQAREASIEQFKAQLRNAEIVLQRAQTLLKTPAGQQATVDTALAAQDALKAQILGAEAQLQQAKINLGYTEIRAPIDGKIGRTAITAGNYVNPASGTLVSIVSQDPMYIVFPVSTRSVIELQQRAGGKAGALVIRVRLPDGRLYDQPGKLDFIDNSVTGNTDTMVLRGIVPNPRRLLVDGELVQAILQDVKPTEALAVPRAAVLADQQGDYVFVVGKDNKVEKRPVKLGQSTPALAAVTSGLSEGENVVVDGIQRVRPGLTVSPGPAAQQVQPPAGTIPQAAKP
ncbi:MAG: efflux RND transporter periplasmic adaptor subunit [Proteobacteria bacterium]|nr:efflux RND transporter periplasmic adaptor subunit [Pseudomonadota bacterium]